MTLMGLLVLLIIAAICGAIGQAISGYSLGGCLVSTAVGFIGALIGRWIAGEFGLPDIFSITIQGETFPVVWAIIGAVIFSLVIGLLTRSRSY